jgi:hypothetical protein
MAGGVTVNGVLVAALAMGLLGCGPSAAEKVATEKEIAEIGKLGGNATVDEKSSGRPDTSVNLSGPKVTDADPKHLQGLTQPQTLNLVGAQVTDAELEHLKGSTQLQTLNLLGTAVTDAGLEHLRGLVQPGHVDLTGTQVSDAGVQALRKAAPRLRISHSTRRTQ